MKNNLKTIGEILKILGWIVTPLFIISQLKQLAIPSDEITSKLHKVSYVLIISKKSKTYKYVFTHDDILNLLRAVYKEGKQEIGVTWTLITRFALLYPESYNDFSTFVKSYAQPINPAWFPTGYKYLNSLKYTSNKQLAFEKARERIKNSKLTLNEIPDYEKTVVFGILDGSIPNPVPTSVHYITSQASAEDNEEIAKQKQQQFVQKRDDLNSPVYYQSAKKGNNWFFNTTPSKRLKITIKKKVIV